MRQLILLRHAKSSWDEHSVADHERLLSLRGERDAPLIGERLRSRGVQPDVILTSDAKRAVATAKIIARCLGYPLAAMRTTAELYLAPPATVLALASAQHDNHASLMIVGHNPGLTELSNQLLPDLALDNLPTTGVVGIDFEIERWSQLAGAQGTLAFYEYPKK